MKCTDGQRSLMMPMIVSGMLVVVALGVSGLRAIAAEQTSVTVKGTASTAAKRHPLERALKMSRDSLEAISKAKGYEAVFAKREVVAGGRVSAHKMRIKLRHEPFSVYLQFHKPHAGREVIFVAGKNNGNLLAHETGIKSIVGTVSLLPNSREAMSESRYPITRIGIAKMTAALVQQWESELKFGECDVKHYSNARLGKTECNVVECKHPVPRKQFKFHLTRLFIAKESGFPVRLVQYGFPRRPGGKAPLLEEYTYTDIRPNAGLTDADFDVRNPKYQF